MQGLVVLVRKEMVLKDAFFVRGRPIPQGSMKFIKPGVMIHSRALELARWRADIARNAELFGFKPITSAVKVDLDFVVSRPKSTKRTYPSVKPDLDKLIRAVLDGLTGVAFQDDSQVILINSSKTYGENQGVWIRIEQILE